MKHGGYDWLERERCAQLMEQIIQAEFDRRVSVAFTGVLDLAEDSEAYQALMQKAEQNIPRPEPRAYGDVPRPAAAPSAPDPPMEAETEGEAEGVTAVCWMNRRRPPSNLTVPACPLNRTA